MSDLISRQAAIDVLNINRNPVFHDSVDYEGAMYDICKLPSAQPEQRWIPVTERLPKPNENVLVTLIDRRRRKIDVNWNGEKRYSTRIDKIVDYEGDMSHPFWAKGNTLSVIAWMPLPEPYREDEE